MKIGGIEAGGTKFVCGVSDDSLQIVDRCAFETTTPQDTLGKITDFFASHELAALGVGSFGPIGVNSEAKEFGSITNTPKLAWRHYDFLGALKDQFSSPVGWTTDVNAAALGEFRYGAASDKRSCLYLTVGTGIGGGLVVDGQLYQAFSHPEMGHISVKRHPLDSYTGSCPYHGDCFEGLAAGPAIKGRTGTAAQNLEESDLAWEIEAYYIAQALVNYTLVLSPEVIILGGGVMKQVHLFDKIRKSFKQQLGDYVQLPALEDYIVPCALGDNAGLIGCLSLALSLTQ